MRLALLVATALTAYRAWRLVAVDTFPPVRAVRDRFVGWVGEDSAWADLLLCPWCLGSHAAWVATLIADCFTSVPLPVFHALATATLVGLIAQVDEG